MGRSSLALVALLLAGCGSLRAVAPASVHHPARARACAAGTVEPLGSAALSVAAVVGSHAVADRRPAAGPFARFGRLNANGVPTVFGVLGAVLARNCRASWYHVQLPLRPNGVTGYVAAREVEVASVPTRIVIDLSAHRLPLFDRGHRVLTTRVAVGSAATPTPTGRYYINQRLVPSDPRGPFGPGALGISAFSNVLTGWTQGGPIAIHGTDEPWTIGRSVSNGCIRAPNPVVRRLFARVPSGTPVVIRA